MNFQEAFFDELVKIAEKGDYLPGGAAWKFLSEARARAEAYKRSKNFLDPDSVGARHLADQKQDWLKKRGIPAPSEVTGIRRLEPLPDPRLPGAPSLSFGQRVRDRIGSIAGRVGFGIRSGIGRFGSFIRGRTR